MIKDPFLKNVYSIKFIFYFLQAFMACVWTIQIFFLAFLYTNLDKLAQIEKFSGSPGQGHISRPLEDQYTTPYRTDYDEDIYKEVGSEANDRKSINSSADSRSHLNDPDDLIETAEGLMSEGRRKFRSLTPNLGASSSKISLNGSLGQRSASANAAVAMETDYGTFEGSLTTPVEDRCHLGSQEYINSTEDGLVDYLEGKSKLKFIYHGECLFGLKLNQHCKDYMATFPAFAGGGRSQASLCVLFLAKQAMMLCKLAG